MASDLFNNPTNNYANPGFAPCIGDPDSNFFQFVKNGVGITSGNEIVSKIDFSNLKIPVSTWSNQIRVINPGEVTFIQGLSKILLSKQQGFTMPTLVSTDEDLDKYFMEIDMSINYYSGFSYSGAALDSSANYDTGVGIDDALTLDLFNASVSVTSTYSQSIMYFNGTVAGYDYTVSNVILTLIDASQNSSSPFAANVINGVRVPITYNLSEDSDSLILAAKHPNTASQGIVLKNIFPSDDTLSTYDKWLYLNHTTDTVTLYEPLDLTFLIDSSSDFIFIFDGSALVDYFNWTDPNYQTDIDIRDLSINSIPQNTTGGIVDASIIEGTFESDKDFIDSSIYNCSFSFSNIIDAHIISDTSVFVTTIDSSDNLVPSYIDNSYISNVYATDVSINNSIIVDSSIENGTMGGSNTTATTHVDFSIWDSSLSVSYLNNTYIYNSYVDDASILGGIITDSSLSLAFVQDASLYNVRVFNNAGQTLENVDTSGGIIGGTSYMGGTIVKATISDSSIFGTIINNDSSIVGSLLDNSWVNVYELLVSTDASGNSTYMYIMDDPTLPIDSAEWRVNITNNEIWDTSINNANIYDSSIFNSYVQDSSLFNCKIYNTPIDRNTLDGSSNTVMVDASVVSSCNIQTDNSTYYTKVTKTLDIGLNGSSTDTVISAGDYLEYVTDNNLWNKVGDLYMWTSAPDSGVYNEINLINGFYLFNPHTFSISAEYLVIA